MSKSEQEFLESYDAANFDRPSVTVDLVLMTVSAGVLKALVLRRDTHPEIGKWSLPGAFVGIKESLDEAAKRALKDKTRIASAYLEQLYTFGAVDRDPRTRVVTVVYFALLPEGRFQKVRGPELCLATVKTAWKGERGGRAELHGDAGTKLEVAFDHLEILGLAVKRLRGKLDYSGIAFELLPTEFTLRHLQEVHEAILGEPLNKPAFRRRMLDKGVLKATGRYEQGTSFRPAELYRFAHIKHQPL
jgi:ADP-ribose pyrophosphatase YjhB (NUDIX family)